MGCSLLTKIGLTLFCSWSVVEWSIHTLPGPIPASRPASPSNIAFT